jgi:hypothetical protein
MEKTASAILVRALSLNVTALLALVADLLASSSLLRTIARVVARLATVVALHAVNALTCSEISMRYTYRLE